MVKDNCVADPEIKTHSNRKSNMLLDIDVHYVARIAHSLSEMDRLIRQGSKSYPHLCRVFQEHKGNCLSLVKVMNDTEKGETENNKKGGGV